MIKNDSENSNHFLQSESQIEAALNLQNESN